MSVVDPRRVTDGLCTIALGHPIVQFDRVGSTNDAALQLLGEGAAHGTTVVANRQTAGRGQRGRTWHSPPSVGLFVSIVLRGSQPLETPTLVVAAVGLGLAEGLEFASGARVGLKWPNDLWCNGRKVAGVLVESRGYRPEQPAFVAGMGVNISHRGVDFPPDVRDSATSLALVTGDRLDRADVLRAVLKALEPRIDQALAGGTGDLEEAYRERSLLRGRMIDLVRGDEALRGEVVDLSAREGLLLRLAGGTMLHVPAEHARDVRPVDDA
jgi:BirA family biotin operon repressor/biotin-[acetyl-CoA-carboxylase] ligase